MKVFFVLFAFYFLNGICTADVIKYKNLAAQAKITASSELKEQGLKASSVADGRIAPALCQHFEFFPSDKGAKSWAVNGETADDKGDLVFEWEEPVFVQELIYFGRTAWLLDECFKDYLITIDDNDVPVAKGAFKKMHGGQRVVFNRQKVKKLTLRFLNSHGGPNPGATEVLLVDQKLSNSEIIQLAPANPPSVSQGPDPISAVNFTWTKPSRGEEDAMPIGNGSLLANVWAEKGGDVRVSLARYSRLDNSAKRIGSLRFQFDPGLNVSPESFRQMLRFKYGEVVVKNIKQKENPSYSFFVDAKRDILHLQFRSKSPVPLKVIFDDNEGKVLSLEDKKQIAKTNGRDALIVLCDGMETKDNQLQTIDSKGAFDLQVHLVRAQENEELDKLIGSVSKVDVNGAVSAQMETWNKFWNRGSVFLSDLENGSEISRALVLRRYLSACSGRGPHSLNPEVIKEIEIPEREILYWSEEKSGKAIKNALKAVKPSLEFDDKSLGFPQFWGSDFSLLPSEKDEVDALVDSLRPLLIETTGKRVCIFPGWPVDKDISFRIDTVTGLGVEVVYRDQEIKRLEVYPKQRTNEVFGLGPYEKKVREALPGPFKMPALISFLSPSWVGPRVGLDNLFVTMKRANFNGLEGSLADFEKSKQAGIYLLLHGATPWSAHELKDDDDRQLWFEGYASTYLERDIPRLSAIEAITDLRRLIAAACLRLGGLLNQADLARDVQLAPSTVQRYLNLLEVSFQLVRLPAYSVNRTKRLVKSPKLYWSDTGLALHLAGDTHPRGAHLENMVLCDLLAWAGARVERTEILFWRTTKGAEVDFVIDTGRRLLPVEVKAAANVHPGDVRHVHTFLDEYSDIAQFGIILYDGEETFWLTDRVLAAPWWRVV